MTAIHINTFYRYRVYSLVPSTRLINGNVVYKATYYCTFTALTFSVSAISDANVSKNLFKEEKKPALPQQRVDQF